MPTRARLNTRSGRRATLPPRNRGWGRERAEARAWNGEVSRAHSCPASGSKSALATALALRAQGGRQALWPQAAVFTVGRAPGSSSNLWGLSYPRVPEFHPSGEHRKFCDLSAVLALKTVFKDCLSHRHPPGTWSGRGCGHCVCDRGLLAQLLEGGLFPRGNTSTSGQCVTRTPLDSPPGDRRLLPGKGESNDLWLMFYENVGTVPETEPVLSPVGTQSLCRPSMDNRHGGEGVPGAALGHPN